MFVKTGDKEQMQELTLSRGFQSSVAAELHFGLNQSKTTDELKVVWTDGKSEILKKATVNQTLVLQYVNAKMIDKKEEVIPAKLFVDSTNLSPEFKHQENENNDFAKQVLLPHKMSSSFGPALAVGDLNNDGLDDYFVGGSQGYSAEMFFQTKNGFSKQEVAAFKTDESSEDVGAVIFDADQDGDDNLYVVSEGYEFERLSKDLQDRMYLNDGKGVFSKAEEQVLPEMLSSGSRFYHADFDKDGKEYLLVLGRQSSGNYPFPAKTYLPKNNTENGYVKFEENSQIISDKFDNLGMATSAVITDFNNDDWLDIIVVGEWMPVKIFINQKSELIDKSATYKLSNTSGLWTSLELADVDGDGDQDIIGGNMGLNSYFEAGMRMYIADFEGNGFIEQIICKKKMKVFSYCR